MFSSNGEEICHFEKRLLQRCSSAPANARRVDRLTFHAKNNNRHYKKILPGLLRSNACAQETLESQHTAPAGRPRQPWAAGLGGRGHVRAVVCAHV